MYDCCALALWWRGAERESREFPEVSHVALSEPAQTAGGNARPRRALIFAGPSVAELLESRLAEAGYTSCATAPADFSESSHIEDFAPDVAVFEVVGAEGEAVALARRLRAVPSTFALPIVFLFHRDERTLRNAALNIGVDDYIALEASAAEMCARLDALFWRAEVGRRAAPVVGEQRAEIDNFLLLLDAVRTDIESGTEGTLALVVANVTGESATRAERERLLAEAHGFLKLNLRRIDAVAFYGPTMLLVYLPRVASAQALSMLSRLREEFLAARREGDLAVGLASFPADGREVEELVDRAESAISAARVRGASSRVVAYGHEETAKRDEPVKNVSPAEATKDAAPSSGATAFDAERGAPDLMTRKEDAPRGGEEGRTGETEARREETSLYSRRPSPVEQVVVRESKSFDAHALHAPASAGLHADGGAFARASADAAARELERRVRGEVMPRRLLLTVSDPARMAQVNLLIRAAGYEVRAAFDGQQALSLLRIERPDLLLLDQELHGFDGVETLRRLRKQSGGRLKLPVVLLLPAGKGELRREALAEGARGIVELPYDPAKLLDVVRTAGTAD